MPCSELMWSIKKVAKKKKISWEELSCSFPWLQAIRAWLNEIANQTTSFLSEPECRDVLFLLSSGDDFCVVVFFVITIYYQNSLTAGIRVDKLGREKGDKEMGGKGFVKLHPNLSFNIKLMFDGDFSYLGGA